MNIFSRISNLRWSMSHKNPHFEDKYALQEKLGAGTFAEVYACEAKKETRASPEMQASSVAVKVFGSQQAKANKTLRKSFQHEVQIMRAISGNQHCVQMLEAFETRSQCYLVMDMGLCSIEEAFIKSLEEDYPVSEQDLAHLCKCMLSGIKHLHDCGFAHRDVKPANLLITEGDSCNLSSRPVVKLCDFGLAKKVPAKKGLTQFCGTAPYIAPEMRAKEKPYDFSVDIFSCGVTMYLMLFGEFPFKGPDWALHTNPRYTARDGFAQPSDVATRFVQRLLTRVPELRPDAAWCLSSLFVQTSLSPPTASKSFGHVPSFGPTLSSAHSATKDERTVCEDSKEDSHDESNEDSSATFEAIEEDSSQIQKRALSKM